MTRRLEELIDTFTKAVIAQNELIMSGRKGAAKIGNKHARTYIKAFDGIVNHFGEQGVDNLKKLFNHSRPDVQEAAAALLLLNLKTQEAIPVLKTLSEMRGLVGLGASEALKRWREDEELREKYGIDGLAGLRRRIDHPKEKVRGMAASLLSNYMRKEIPLEHIKKLSQVSGTTGMGALAALEYIRGTTERGQNGGDGARH